MMPQLSAAQLQKAVDNFQVRVDAKASEVGALEWFTALVPDYPGLQPQVPAKWIHQLAAAVTQYLSAKVDLAKIELEELKMQQAGLKQGLERMRSGIILPTH